MKKIFVILFFYTTLLFAEAGNYELGIETNYSGYLKLDNYSHGVGIGGNFYYNFTDFWGISSSLNYSKHLTEEKYDILNLYTGIIYNLDILRLVPVFEGGLSYTLLNNYELETKNFSINGYFGFTLSYLLNWEKSVAFFIRYEKSLKSYEEIFDSYFVLGVRLNFIFE